MSRKRMRDGPAQIDQERPPGTAILHVRKALAERTAPPNTVAPS